MLKDLIILAQKIMVEQVSYKQSIEIGILKVLNSDGSWNVQLKGRTDYYYGLIYNGPFKLAINDSVSVGFHEGDRQRPFILAPSSYKSGTTITEYTYNKD